MKFHFKGKYNGDPMSLPTVIEIPNSVKFKEADDAKSLGKIVNSISIIIFLVCLGIGFLVNRKHFTDQYSFWNLLGLILPLLMLFPHEMLHAICYKEDVYMYTNFENGLAFIVGPELMSKKRFVFMSLLPNIVLGVIPYIVGLLFPQYIGILLFGGCCISMGAGDYYNVFHALTQMPKGSKTYLYGMNSYWVPQENN